MKIVLRRLADRAQSCLKQLDCEESTVEYTDWQSAMGWTDAVDYLCSDDVRECK